MGAALSLVLFDMDDVLCTYSRQARAEHIAAVAGCSPAKVLAAIWDSGFESLGDSGALDADAYLRGFGDCIGYRVTLEQWLAARKRATIARHDVLALVRRLRVRSAVLTNNPTLVTDHIDAIFPELTGLFLDRLYASAAFKTAKPDPNCFLKCLAVLGGDPATTIFIDDLSENVDGARQAGLQAHQYTSLSSLTEVLTDHGLLHPVD